MYSDDFNGKRIFSSVYSLFELKINNKNYYYLIFTTPGDNFEGETGDYYTVKRFSFNDYDLTNHENLIKTVNKFPDKVISGFVVEEENIIVIFYLKKRESGSKLFAQYNIRFYDYDMNKIGNNAVIYNDELQKDKHIIGNVGMYSNSIYFKDRIALFIYFHIGKFVFQCLKVKLNSDGNYGFDEIFYDEFKERFDYNIALNGVHKISDDRVSVVTSKDHGTTLYIILLDFFGGSYEKRKFRIYNLKLFNNYRAVKELAIYSHENLVIQMEQILI